jgi:hypothetical protein
MVLLSTVVGVAGIAADAAVSVVVCVGSIVAGVPGLVSDVAVTGAGVAGSVAAWFPRARYWHITL